MCAMINNQYARSERSLMIKKRMLLITMSNSKSDNQLNLNVFWDQTILVLGCCHHIKVVRSKGRWYGEKKEDNRGELSGNWSGKENGSNAGQIYVGWSWYMVVSHTLGKVVYTWGGLTKIGDFTGPHPIFWNFHNTTLVIKYIMIMISFPQQLAAESFTAQYWYYHHFKSMN